MRRLFSMKCDGVFWVEEENAVYSIYNFKNKSHRFFDAQGNELLNYRRIDCSNDQVQNDTVDFEGEDDLVYNKYGIACSEHCLVDCEGNEIPDTELNSEDSCSEWDRYFVFSLLSDEQIKSIDRCGTASDILVDVYDTKTRTYIVKAISECRLKVSSYDGEPEVILAAVNLLPEFDTVSVKCRGTIVGKKDGSITVFDYYATDE